MEPLSLIQKLAIWTLPVLFAITLHEYAHGWIAKRCGDPTASDLGRLTVNPIKHIDLVGTIIVPAIIILTSPFVFGWAKPVPVNWRRLANPKTDMVWVALAGPGANLLMALFWALVFRLVNLYDQGPPWLVGLLLFMSTAGVFVNSIMMVLNLVPIPPLDGGRILSGLVSPVWARRLARVEPFGIFIVFGLLLTGWLGFLIGPVISFVVHFYSVFMGVTTGQLDVIIAQMLR